MRRNVSDEKMGKRSDLTEVVIIAIELLRHIPRHRKVTSRELLDHLNTVHMKRDIRTVQRQLDLLSGHFPIECDTRTRPYGYSWQRDAKPFSLSTLTPRESLILLLAEQNLKTLLPASLMQSLAGFFGQAKNILATPDSDPLIRQWPSKIAFAPSIQPLLPPPITEGIFEAVTEALFQNCYLDIEYRNVKGKSHQARFMPLGLIQQDTRLYLVGQYENSTEARSLALHRMQSAVVCSSQFERPHDFDLDQFVQEGRLNFGEGRKIRLSFYIDEEMGVHLMEARLAEDQEMKHLPHRKQYKVTATVTESTLLDGWLLTYSDFITRVVRKPVTD